MDYQSPKSASSSTNKSRSFSSDYSSNCEPKPLPPGEYEVFLSFRGPDVRTNFVDYLYSRLIGSRIRTFRDEEGLPKGEVIASSLVEAITESKIYIPVFSGKYAESKWCLQELAKMVECWKRGKGHIILPIFYFVNPRDVRSQTGPYEEAFELHSQKHDADTVKEWRKALKQVGQMKGWTVNESDGQGAIVDMVFSRVDRLLMMNYKLVSDQDFVGVDFHVEKVMKLLDFDSQSVKLLSIHGIGGIGKTTLAKAVYDKVYTKFDGCCFLEDVWDTLTKSEGALSLQNKIISTILRRDVQIQDTSIGTHVIKDRICKHKVLIVLDNVGEAFEFDKILGKIGNFSLGSRFMITTRSLIKVNENDQFCMHNHIRDLGRAIVRDENVEDPGKRSRIWSTDDALDMLKSKQLTFQGTVKVRALSVHLDCELTEKEFNNLSKLRYLEVKGGRLMGDFTEILRDIRWLRLSSCTSIPTRFQMNKLVTLELENIEVGDDWQVWNEIKMANKLKVITLLDCGEVRKTPDLSRCGALELIHFELCLNMSGRLDIGNLKRLKELRVMECQVTKLTADLEGLGCLVGLERLELEGCDSVEILPSPLWKLAKMKTLILKGNPRFRELRSIWHLSSLLNLDISRCDSLKRLLNLSRLKNLKSIRVDSCKGLTELTGLEGLESLEVLEVTSCVSVNKLSNLSTLKKLKQLKIEYCSELSEVTGLEGLESLEELELEGFSLMRKLPGLSNLKKLKSFMILGFTELTEISGLGRLKSLEEIYISDCTSMKRLSDLSSLTKLKRLKISRTKLRGVKGVEGLESLEKIILVDCESIKKSPDLRNLKNLRLVNVPGTYMNLLDTKNLETISNSDT
ncbi:Disease resistance protein L6 [Linum perenne]